MDMDNGQDARLQFIQSKVSTGMFSNGHVTWSCLPLQYLGCLKTCRWNEIKCSAYLPVCRLCCTHSGLTWTYSTWDINNIYLHNKLLFQYRLKGQLDFAQLHGLNVLSIEGAVMLSQNDTVRSPETETLFHLFQYSLISVHVWYTAHIFSTSSTTIKYF